MKLPPDFTFSQSNLQSFVNCHHQFYLRYIRKLAWPAQSTADDLRMQNHLQAGSRFHTLIHQYFLGLPVDRLAQIAASDPLPEMQTWWHLFQAFARDHLSGESLPEFSVRSTLADSPLIAKFDLLNIQPDRLTIYDWKTNYHPIRRAALQKSLQTRVYPFVLFNELNSILPALQLSPEDITLVYWQANSPESPLAFPYTPDQHAANSAYLSSLLQDIASFQPEDFTRTTNDRTCRFCVYRSLCERGLAAGSLDDLKDEAPDDDSLADFTIQLDTLPEVSF